MRALTKRRGQNAGRRPGPSPFSVQGRAPALWTPEGAGALKKYVTESVNEFLAPHRERRAELAKDMDAIRDILHDGNKRANAIAEETLDEVRAAMGMKY